MVEAAAGNRRNPHLGHQMAGELDVVGESETADVGHDVVGPARSETPEPARFKQLDQQVAPPPVARREVRIVGVGQRQGRRSRLLQRRRRPHGQEVVHFADRRGQRRRGDGPAHAPSRHAVGLRQAVDGDGAVRHAVDGRHRHVPGPVIKDVLVDLVRDGQHVPPAAQRGDGLELAAAEDLAGRVVRRVDDDRPRPRAERGGQRLRIERPVGRMQRDVAGRRPRQDGIRAVVLVERLEHDHLVAGVDRRQHRRHHRLGRTAAHRHLRLGIDRHAVPPREVAGHRLAQRLRAPRHRVLVDVGGDGRPGRRLQRLGRGEVGEPLRQVHRPVPVGETGHLADHRLGEPGRLARAGAGGHRRIIPARTDPFGPFGEGRSVRRGRSVRQGAVDSGRRRR